jgi:hypothetical protein
MSETWLSDDDEMSELERVTDRLGCDVCKGNSRKAGAGRYKTQKMGFDDDPMDGWIYRSLKARGIYRETATT